MSITRHAALTDARRDANSTVQFGDDVEPLAVSLSTQGGEGSVIHSIRTR